MGVPTKGSNPIRLGVDNIFIQQNTALSFNKLQHRETFVEQKKFHDLEPCISSLKQFISSKMHSVQVYCEITWEKASDH